MKYFMLLLAICLFYDKASAQTIRYADGQLTAHCTNGTYHAINRTCNAGGGDGDAYGTTNGSPGDSDALQAAINASAATDTVRVRVFNGVYTRGQGGGGFYYATGNGVRLKSGSGSGRLGTLDCTNCFKVFGWGNKIDPATGRPTDGPVIRSFMNGFDNEGTIQYVHLKDLIIDGRQGFPNPTAQNAGNHAQAGISEVINSKFENIIIRNVNELALSFTEGSQVLNSELTSWGMWTDHGDVAQCHYPVSGGYCHGFYGEEIYVDGGWWHHGDGYAFHLRFDPSNTTIKNMRISHNLSGGIWACCNVPGPMLIYNVIVDSNLGQRGIYIGGIANTEIYSTTIVNNATDGICNDNVPMTVRNSIVVGNGNNAITRCDGSSAGAVSNNLTIGTPPSIFANVAAGDFHLCTGPKIPTSTCPGSSAAVGGGFPLTAPTNTMTGALNLDMTGALRTVPFDMGALETGVVANTPPLVTITTNGGNPISTGATSFTLDGTASDDVSVSTVAWSNSRGGSGSCSGTATWKCANIPVFVGTNTITVTATDNTGLTSTDTILITSTPTHPGDTLALALGFSENTGSTTADSSTNNNTGTLAAGAAWTSSGRYGSAISFDGINDSVNVADSNTLDFTQRLTVMAWVFPTEATSAYRPILYKNGGGAGSANPPYFLFASGTACGAGSIHGGIVINDDGIVRRVCDPTPLVPNVWTHVAMTYDGTNLRLYRDGAVCATCTLAITGLIAPSTGNLTIGSGDGFFKGTLDEVRADNYARSEAQIISDKDTSITAPVPPTQVKLSSGTIRKFVSGAIQKMAQ